MNEYDCIVWVVLIVINGIVMFQYVKGNKGD